VRQTVIPAQITTVEDKIVANLNLTQIVLVACSLFIGIFIFAVLPQKLHFNLYKLPLIGLSTLICFTLALKVKGRVVINWILLLAGYYLRPSYYIFDKNEAFLREIDFFPEIKKKKKIQPKPAPAESKNSAVIPITDFARLERILIAHRGKLNLKFHKEGGIDATW